MFYIISTNSIVLTIQKKIDELKASKVQIDTTTLTQLVKNYEQAVYRATEVKPRINTSEIEQTIQQSVKKAIDTLNLSDLTQATKHQTHAIEHNNRILINGTGWRLKWYVLLLTLILGVVIGWSVNWYFEIPAKVAGVTKYQKLQKSYDALNEIMRKDCTLTKAFYKNRGWQWNNNACEQYPFTTSQDLISGK